MYERFAKQVKEFDVLFKGHVPTRKQVVEQLIDLGVPPDAVTDRAIDALASLHRRAAFGTRLGLIVEEAGEWCDAFLKEKPQAEQDKELADLLYVTIGAGDVLGSDDFDGEVGGMARVLEKNQIKIDDPSRMRIGENGKIIKPEDQ